MCLILSVGQLVSARREKESLNWRGLVCASAFSVKNDTRALHSLLAAGAVGIVCSIGRGRCRGESDANPGDVRARG